MRRGREWKIVALVSTWYSAAEEDKSLQKVSGDDGTQLFSLRPLFSYQRRSSLPERERLGQDAVTLSLLRSENLRILPSGYRKTYLLTVGARVLKPLVVDVIVLPRARYHGNRHCSWLAKRRLRWGPWMSASPGEFQYSHPNFTVFCSCWAARRMARNVPATWPASLPVFSRLPTPTNSAFPVGLKFLAWKANFSVCF